MIAPRWVDVTRAVADGNNICFHVEPKPRGRDVGTTSATTACTTTQNDFQFAPTAYLPDDGDSDAGVPLSTASRRRGRPW